VYNLFMVYQSPFFRSQQGVVGHILGGWNFSPIFTAGSGLPLYCNTFTDAQAFGGGDGANFFNNEQCILANGPGTFAGSSSANYGIPGSNGTGDDTAGSTASSQVNIFKDPNASYNLFRAPILGIDKRDGGVGQMRGLPYWNTDLSIRKNLKITERVSTEFQFLFLNVFNHMQFSDPYMDISDPTDWGVLNAQGNTPRQMEFGIRVKW